MRLPLPASDADNPDTHSVVQEKLVDIVQDDVFSGLIRANADVTGQYAPKLIANRPGHTMKDELESELSDCDAFDMSVAFVSAGAVGGLQQKLYDWHDSRAAVGGSKGRIITSTKNFFNSPKAFWDLLKIQEKTDIDVRIWHDESESGSGKAPNFHPKGYVFTRRSKSGDPYFNLYVGSSNLTETALNGTQREWNLKVSSLPEGELVRQFREELDAQISESEPLTEEWIKQYEEDFKKYAPPRREVLESLKNRDIKPNAMQREALTNLQKLRDEGEHRAIIVSATGTGKTYLSAFDVRQYHPKRMLYIAQQHQILKAAMKSYQRVLGCPDDELGLFTGGSKEHDRKYVFATVQTLSRPDVLEQFASDEFDYILVDEVHHAGAVSYQRVMDHFRDADFMLGMTATPERTDGINIFELFGYNIAYEIRLQKALDEDMLCPFEYHGVAEYLGDDGESIDVAHGATAKENSQLTYEINQLATKERVRYIIDKLQQYGQYHQQITGLVFCSRQEEAERLSDLFNQQYNQQAERNYRTAAVTSSRYPKQEDREPLIRQLESGELDYLFTVDLFNEGVDIPALNQIVMLRNTQSSIIFTQQLGRGLRKFPHKDRVVVIDFIGNYANNYLIPVALYGNTGDRDIARKNLQRSSIGLSSISFDPIAKERILKSLDTADWSDMKKLTEQYRQIRYEYGRIPMLVDVYDYDPSLPLTLAAKKSNYLEFVRSREQSLSHGKNADGDFLDQLEPVSDVENGILKMATSVLLPGLRPHELVILDELCRFSNEYLGDTADTSASTWRPASAVHDSALVDSIRERFPEAYMASDQFESALHVLDYSYFDASRKRFGGTPLVERDDNGMCRLTEAFTDMLASNRTFRISFADALRVGLRNCRDLYATARENRRPFDRGFLYEQKYALADVMRLCGWHKELNGQNVGGYFRHKETNTMPIFVKYAASQYEDRFLNPQEMAWFSKNGRTPNSPEFQWMREGTGKEAHEHFVPLFVMRREEADDKKYYYVGHVAALENAELTTKSDASGEKTVNVTLSTLRLARPLDAELYRHISGNYEG
ncbi:DUF3427 domain-containing protein [Bifidobacterium sp. SMB2]|uniref:DUF3427 domain-containing protein n=1 Tax=Bifidobacterium saimiriisciurei TaxID=2661627 RepID=A0ABX0CAJ0_9BIFI|nr:MULTISPECIES: DUF3427 domain-containing protein [Bifidobacterium]NEG95419.1 DUF3427 domain-containing protein [Bifidobacterium sp. SMB2]NEH11397.1 DUF3427 domain-containing protein [Bifidobacterium saimiriisciurei]